MSFIVPKCPRCGRDTQLVPLTGGFLVDPWGCPGCPGEQGEPATETPADRARRMVQQHGASPGAVWTDSPQELHAALVQAAHDLIAESEAHEAAQGEMTRIARVTAALGPIPHDAELSTAVAATYDRLRRERDEARAEVERLRAELTTQTRRGADVMVAAHWRGL